MFKKALGTFDLTTERLTEQKIWLKYKPIAIKSDCNYLFLGDIQGNILNIDLRECKLQNIAGDVKSAVANIEIKDFTLAVGWKKTSTVNLYVTL